MDKECYYEKDDFKLLHGNTLFLLKKLKPPSVDMIFADPPYFLSGDGITCSAGKMVSVKKGEWDEKVSIKKNIALIRNGLKPVKEF